jgi:acyl carrier protein
MSDINKIKETVFNAIDEFNLSQEIENKLEKSEDQILFSRAGFTEAGKLDSLTLVYFLVTIEEYLQKEFGNDFDLNTQDLIESKEQNLKNIASLISYIQNRI